jgi:hypothetical protein
VFGEGEGDAIGNGRGTVSMTLPPLLGVVGGLKFVVSVELLLVGEFAGLALFAGKLPPVKKNS